MLFCVAIFRWQAMIVLLSEIVSRPETQFLRYSMLIIAGIAVSLSKCKTMFWNGWGNTWQNTVVGTLSFTANSSY